MDNFIFVLFAGIGFMVTFAGVIFGVIKIYYFFEDDFPKIQMKQSDILRKIDFLEQRIQRLEGKVND